ncbi:MAG: glycosyltransferase family 9 protein [Oligoflexales bacterium]|nr:glycosyltransferase family 9 protein [Oligoflexales bacterium]
MPSSPKDIIWIQTSFLGDIIVNTGGIRLIGGHFPKARQHFVTTQVGKQALFGQPLIDSITVFDKSAKNQAGAFKRVKSALLEKGALGDGSVILQPHRSMRSSLLAKYLGVPVITYRESVLSFLTADVRVDRVALFHEAVRIALLAEPLGIAREDILKVKPWLSPLEGPPDSERNELLKDGMDDKSALFSFLSSPRGKIVALAPGSVWGTKRWEAENFIILAGKLVERDDVSVILIGSSAERSLTDRIMNEVRPDKGRIWNMAGKTTLDDLRFIFPRLDLLVSNDSSPVHYASAFNVPTVAVFGSTVPQMGFAPLADKSVSVGINLDCRPCSDHGPDKCPRGHFRCMKELSADMVYDRCVERL